MKVPCIVVVFPRIAADPWKNHDQAEDATFKRAARCNNRSTSTPVKAAAYGLLFASRQPIGVLVVALSQHLSLLVMPVRVRGTSNLVTVTWGDITEECLLVFRRPRG